MTKLLVVTDNHAFGSELVEAAKENMGFEKAVLASHNYGLAIFLIENPTHVVILEYSDCACADADRGHTYPGRESYKEIKFFALEGVRILRTSFGHRADGSVKRHFPFDVLREMLFKV